jgi:integrase
MAIFTTTAVERFVRAGVPQGKPHASLRDGSGLVLRLLPTGAASWQYVYRMRGLGRAGTQRTVTLGPWPAVTCTKAIAEARTLAGKVAGGNDPRAEIREAKQRERVVLSSSLDDYEVWLTSRRLMRVAPMLSSLRRGLAHLLSYDIKNLDRTTLIDAIERIERSGRPGAAREFRQRLRSFVNRQLSLGAIIVDPLAGYRAPAASKQDTLEAEANGRALNEDEIHAVWRSAEAMGGPFGGLVRMALLTGLRRNELASMCWSWIDRDAIRIAVPAASMKSGREHSIPLTPMIMRLLGETPNRGGNLLFPSERRLGGSTPLAGWSHLIIALRQASGVMGFGLHDLRRTFRTALADLNVSTEVAEAAIAHKRTGLIARYDRSKLWTQRREAAETYDAWLNGVVNRTDGPEAGNVVRLGKRAAK